MSLERLRYPIDALKGRKYHEPPHRYRNEFQRDRDRIVHARAFRRLEDKTQVFGERLSDHFRNRLTHTIEVSQIARTLAVSLGLAEDFTEALALAHDIGHPPFAHAGEEALNLCMSKFGDSFDHNVHALHIVESFEVRYARFPGLNLTFEVREGMVKHSRDFAPGERAEFEEYLPGFRPPLEAQLIDLADEVAYNSADLDDGYSAGMFDMEEIAEALPHYAELSAEILYQFPGAPEKVRFQEVLRRLIDLLVSGLIEGTAQSVQSSRVESVEDVRRFPSRLVTMTQAAADTNRGLKKFLYDRVYSTPALVEERVRACDGIERLFQFFLDHPEEMPEGHADRIGLMPAHRVVCDYIAGMTDGFFRRTAARLLA